MPRQYMIENGTENNRWLAWVDHDGKGVYHEQTNSYRPRIEEARVFTKRADAIAFAKRWKARVWLVKDGVPAEMVWPEVSA